MTLPADYSPLRSILGNLEMNGLKSTHRLHQIPPGKNLNMVALMCEIMYCFGAFTNAVFFSFLSQLTQ